MFALRLPLKAARPAAAPKLRRHLAALFRLKPAPRRWHDERERLRFAAEHENARARAALAGNPRIF